MSIEIAIIKGKYDPRSYSPHLVHPAILTITEPITIAVRLGPFYLGVYGMVNLVISYFGQVNFGVPHALNVFLIHNKENRQVGDLYSYNAFALYTYLNMAIVIGSGVMIGSRELNTALISAYSLSRIA